MFTAKTQKINKIITDFSKEKVIKDIEKLFVGNTSVYIDYANVRPWATKLNWNIDLKRQKQFLDSFDNISDIKIYQGYLNDKKDEIDDLEKLGYTTRTKPVKIMNISIDVSSIATDSTYILNNFVRKALLRKLDLETIEFLNNKLKLLNNNGELFIEDRKCNFDVEIGVDMLLDHEKNGIDTFVLWSGDSDFADIVQKLLDDGKNVILFATARRVSRELSDKTKEGLIIFDIQKIKEFICWNRQI